MAHPKRDRNPNSHLCKERMWTRRRRGGLKTIPAGHVRRRLVSLSKAGIGRKAVHAVTGIDNRTLAKIKNGQTKRVGLETARLIKSVPFNAHSDLAVIDAKPTWELIDKLREWDMGFSKSEIARRLGAKQKYPTLNINPERITARTAMRVRKLYDCAIGI